MVALRTKIKNTMPGDYFPVTGHLMYHVGVDLGSLRDPTAVAIIRDELRPAATWGAGRRQLFEPRKLELCQMYRLKVGTSWPEIVDHVARIRQVDALHDARMIIDTSGVGAVAADMLREKRVPFHAVTITAGDKFTEVEHDKFRVAKMYLLTSMATLLQSGELKIASRGNDVKTFRQQVEDFSAVYTAAGNMTFASGDGRHDDLLLATALACFSVSTIKTHTWSVTPLNW